MKARDGSCFRALRAGALAILLATVTSACLVAAPPFPTLPAWDELDRVARAPEPDEQKLWDEARKGMTELVEAKEEYTDAALSAYLEGIVARIAPPIAEGGPHLVVRVIRDVESNASALPDGTILIALTLLASLRNEAQLAFVLAHEVVHVAKRHALLSTRYDAATRSHVDRMRLSRSSEAEADRNAIALMARAGYSVREAAPALTHIVTQDPDSGEGRYAWRSHDDLGSRLAVIRVAAAGRRASDGESHAERFQRALDDHRLAAVTLELEAGRFDDALALVSRHLERWPEAGSAYALRARIRGARDPKLRHGDVVGADLERAIEFSPRDPDALRALGLFLRDTGQAERSRAILRRYLEACPDAFDRKIIERYLAPPAG